MWKNMWKDFKAFAFKGNVIDMSVGVIIGGAFGKIVTSMVNDLLMPLIGIITGGVDFTSLSVTIGDSSITYGNLIQNIVDFLIVAVCIFFFVQAMNKLENHRKRKEAAEEPAEEAAPAPTEAELLAEIRDLLKEQKDAK